MRRKKYTYMNDIKKKNIHAPAASVNPVIAGIAGVIAGGVAVAAAVAMSDKTNQKKVKEALTDAKDKVSEYVQNAKEQPVVERGAHKLEEIAMEAKKKLKIHK